MRNRLSMIALITAIMAVSCQKLHRNDDVPDSAWFATADQIEMSEAGTRRITVYTTCDWTVESSAEWVTVEPKSGKSGVSELTLTFSENTGTEQRTAEINCTAGTYTDTYVITQKAAETL